MDRYAVPSELEVKLVARRGRLHAYQAIPGDHTALAVVDMQNFFMKRGELMCAEGSDEIVPNVNRLAAAVREAGGIVVWIQAEAQPQGLDTWHTFNDLFRPQVLKRRGESLGRGGEGFKLWRELDARPGDRYVIKNRFSAFIQGASDIESVLRAAGSQYVLITGVATNVCCESTGRDCMMRGFKTIMVSDGNASFTRAEHDAALLNFITYFGDVQSTDEVIAHLQVVPAALGA
ncbi:MAG: cysteine hydrolase [Burkholderiales bacterium]|nr:cysteine hydrolase [Burkholderiales bacterium]